MSKKLIYPLTFAIASLLIITTTYAASHRRNFRAQQPTALLTLSSTTITLGTPVGLAWTTSNANSVAVSASPDQPEWSGSVSPYGAQTVTPTTVGTVEYDLSASGYAGTINTSVSLTVLAPVAAVLPPAKQAVPTPTNITSQATPVVQAVTQPVVQTVQTVAAPLAAGIQWGAFAGNSAASLSSFESLVGAPVDVQAIFVGWTDDLPTAYKTTVAGTGKTLLVYWEPTVDDDTINSGSQDSLITNFAQELNAYGGKVILALNEEVNCDNSSPWGGTSGNNNSAKAISMFQRIHDLVKTIAPNVLFAYDVNNDSCYSSSPSNSLTAYYPGNSYVDIVGVSGFNFGNPWATWQQTFIGDNAIPTLQTLGKPLWILSTGSIDGPQKGQWITDMVAGVKKYNIAGVVWFNQNDAAVPSSGDSINWKIDSNASSLSAFQAAVQSL